MNTVELRRIGKVFHPGLGGSPILALADVDLLIAEGETLGLLGPNGSGKTTLLKIILGLLAPTSGSCMVFGRSSRCVESREAVGFLPETPEFPHFLTGLEVVRFHARLSGLAGHTAERRVREAVELVGMGSEAKRRVGTYSRGMKQRIGLAQALVSQPRLVVLDEPAANLDPEGAADFAAIIRMLQADGATLLLSSHQLDQVGELCTSVAVLSRGRLVASGRIGDFIRSGGEGPERLVVEALEPAGRPGLGEWLAVRGARMGLEPGDRHAALERAYLASVWGPSREKAALQ